ncbi:thioredoxin family protein [Alloacidobacterium dinghuense]|uniref:Thioredoxin family protein n=1 Tax=Alloacidobacterium dinghuense TaxID=2763107 RepID=A0A7G8BCE6_9BACT|nr:thioredoxin family protein [Alloacidobacterium dinghuense]QNI30216.1 thioredoxin family protein [Alloacidobacterium dinghuense]
MRIRTLISTLCLLIFSAWTNVALSAPTATAQHLTVQLVVPPAEIYPGQNFTAGLYFKLEPGWHVYWINAGDSGEPPRIKWTLPEGITADAMQFPAPKRLPLGPLMDFGYENEVLFPMAMHVSGDFKPAGESVTLGSKVDWLVCREVCIPGKASLDIERKALSSPPSTPTFVAADQQLVARLQRTLPQPLPGSMQAKFMPTATGFNLTVITGRREADAQFFPFDQNQLANAAPQPVTPLSNGFQISLKKDENLQQNPGQLHGLVVLADGNAFEINAAQGTVTASESSRSSDFAGLGRVAGLAFIGGVILNLMPCVFPVLFIKGLALVQSSQHERHKLRAHGWVYALGILASFWAVVAVLLVLRAGGRQLGWGFQFQSPSFIAVIALLLFFLGLSLAGLFEIGLSLTSKGSGLAGQHGYAGSFFTGVLAMVVATPCTAPFMGAAIGYALAHSAIVSFVIFTALGLGLAAPYVLLTLQPAWTKLLPRPGAWMEILKQATAIPIFATVIWLVWLFAQSAGLNALAGLLAAFLLLAVAGWILGRWPAKAPATAAAIAVLALAVALPIYGVRKLGTTSAHVNTASNSQWESFSPALVEKYRTQGRPVFIDFTASWCLSCQVNERVILSRSDVQQKLHDRGFALVRADWTNADESITQTLNSLGRSGVPTYAIYPGSMQEPPHVLPEVLTPGIVLDAIDQVQPRQAALDTAR